jgi:hypothetical protein
MLKVHAKKRRVFMMATPQVWEKNTDCRHFIGQTPTGASTFPYFS